MIVILTTLLLAAMAWGYFDGASNVAFRVKMGMKTKTPNPDQKAMVEFFQNDPSFKIASIAKITAFVSILVACFHLPVEQLAVIAIGYFLGQVACNKMNTFDKLTGQVNVLESCEKSIFYSNIYIGYISLYYVVSIVLS